VLFHLVTSLVLHVLLIIPFLVTINTPEVEKEVIKIEIVKEKYGTSDKKSKVLGKYDFFKLNQDKTDGINKEEPYELGSDGSGTEGLTIGQLLSADNYISKIKRIIYPSWTGLVSKRITVLLKSKRKFPVCRSVVTVTIGEGGEILNTRLVGSCDADNQLDGIALQVWKNRLLPPPPKDLLKGGIVKITWNFILEK
jgi:hypothetical protein